MRISIDQELCTGGGSCDDIAPDVFWRGDDDLAYVKEDHPSLGETRLFHPDHGNPAGPDGVARVPEGLEDLVTRAIDECPGACIEVVDEVQPAGDGVEPATAEAEPAEEVDLGTPGAKEKLSKRIRRRLGLPH